MAQQGSGFDMSKLSNASKILLGAGILLLLDSFIFSWQKVCISFGTVSGCAKAGMWGGSGSFAGTIAGLLVIALIAWEIIGVAGMQSSMKMPIPASKISAYLGFGVFGFVVLKFLLAVGNSGSLGMWIGLVLAIAIGYGAWMRFQEPASSMPSSGGDAGGGGFTS